MFGVPIDLEVESFVALKTRVSDVADTTLPVSLRLPKLGETILTREPAATGQSAIGASCAADREEAAAAATHSTIAMTRIYPPAWMCTADIAGHVPPRIGVMSLRSNTSGYVGVSRMLSASRDVEWRYIQPMKPRTKFLIGGALVIGTAGYLAASAIRDTGVYYLTPGELSAKTRTDPTFYETGVKVGARVVKGSIVRDPGGRQVAFKMTDGAETYNVVYRGITPDTFTDGVDVVVEGRLGRDNTFRATTLLAKCASRYENAPDKYKQTPGYKQAGQRA